MWCALPKLPVLERLFTGLVFKNTKVVQVPAKLTPTALNVLTYFVQPTGEVVCACLCDPQFVAFSTCALTMVPPGAANDYIKKAYLSPEFIENFAEVMNVLSSKLTESPNRVILRFPIGSAGAIADDAAELLAKPPQRIELEVDITGYGKGRLALYAR